MGTQRKVYTPEPSGRDLFIDKLNKHLKGIEDSFEDYENGLIKMWQLKLFRNGFKDDYFDFDIVKLTNEDEQVLVTRLDKIEETYYKLINKENNKKAK